MNTLKTINSNSSSFLITSCGPVVSDLFKRLHIKLIDVELKNNVLYFKVDMHYVIDTNNTPIARYFDKKTALKCVNVLLQSAYDSIKYSTVNTPRYRVVYKQVLLSLNDIERLDTEKQVDILKLRNLFVSLQPN